MYKIFFLLLVFSFNLNASISVNGDFHANQSCPAYLSKNRQTNPGNLRIEQNQHYVLREINRPSPDWFRIEYPDQNQLRWIQGQCGRFQYRLEKKQGCDVRAGMADSYVLALSWQPAFCQTYGYEAGKPECLNLSESSYSSKQLSLHGLWPNQKACGHHYNFCDVVPKHHHCAYPPIQLNSSVETALKRFMPSFAYGSCLERHEWNKHGRCQTLSSDHYFTQALRLAGEANHSKLGQFVQQHRGRFVTQDELREQIISAFGHSSAHKIYLGCKNGLLVDIFIQLPAVIPDQDTLEELITRAPELDRYNGCPRRFKISDFNKHTDD